MHKVIVNFLIYGYFFIFSFRCIFFYLYKKLIFNLLYLIKTYFKIFFQLKALEETKKLLNFN